eukprot:TRINITY_DN11219_c1_g1_i1.p1 TRINITY_DN11219_c1_g1~~TRINITY_DN11219_c1_g1_i1.p1  ORF type:complete len:161 (-),score=34.87 TRINITY_DN11219_c1_g1_i1:100-510(-)
MAAELAEVVPDEHRTPGGLPGCAGGHASPDGDVGDLMQQSPSERRRRARVLTGGYTSCHDVTPYSEVYGAHPRHFDFDRDGSMLPRGLEGFSVLAALAAAALLKGDEDDEEEEEQEVPAASPILHACGARRQLIRL